MSTTEAVFVKKQITIDPYLNILNVVDEDVKLYIPLNSKGITVHPKTAEVLKCWVYKPDEKRTNLPVICDRDKAGGLSLALLQEKDFLRFASFYRLVTDMDGLKLRDWMMHMHRSPSHDIRSFTVEVA